MGKIIDFIGIALMGAALASCGGRPSAGEGYRHTVLLTRPEPLSSAMRRTLPGVVEESAETSLGFKAAGQIAATYVKEGAYVSKGQILARLDDADYRLGADAARIQFEQMEGEVARLSKLYEGRSISKNDYDKAVAGLEQLRIQKDAKQRQVDYCELRSPVAGHIRSVNFSVGEMVNAGTPFVEIISSGESAVVADVSSEVYSRRDAIESVECRLSTGETLPLRILSFSPKADGNQLFRMRLGFMGKASSELTPGTNVEVSLRIGGGDGEAGFTVPEHAVSQDNGQAFVWVFSADSSVRRTPVEVSGIEASGRVLISGGLGGDEAIVKAGVDALTDGDKVRVRGVETESNVGGLL